MDALVEQPLARAALRGEPIIPTIIPTTYWISQGIAEPIAYSMERFQFQLVDRKYTFAHVIYFGPATTDIDFIPHHDLLVSHWRRYIKNLTERGRAKAFFIERFQLRQSVLDIIVPTLMQQLGQLGELGLCDCSIGRNGLLLISKYLSKNRSLKRLLLNENQIEDVDIAKALSSAVKYHPSMEEVCLSHCGLGNNLDILPEILGGCNHLKTLRLNGNNIGSESIAQIKAFLAGNQTLTCLRLDNNLLSDADALHISAALKMNTNLHYLYLKGNAFSYHGKKKMMDTILDAASLNSIVESNHNCEIVFSFPVAASHINEKFWSPERKAQSKIILALYGVGDIAQAAQYFRDVPLELIPYGLELIQKELDCLEQHDAISFGMKNAPSHILSRLFCFLRVWNLPWLFNNGVQPMQICSEA